MSTAHRPTWHPAVAQATSGSYRYYAPRRNVSVRAIQGNLKLSLRQGKEASEERTREQLKELLELREAEHFEKMQSELKRKGAIPYAAQEELPRIAHHSLAAAQAATASGAAPPANSAADEGLPGAEDTQTEQKLDEVDWDQFDDADDSSSSGGSSDEDSDSSSEDDEDDEQAELMRELARIKAEREEARRKVEQAQEAARQAEASEAVLRGNPLLDPSLGDEESFEIKRRWDDDVVFRNQSRNVPNKSQKRFVNDTIRSDFHRRFLDRYIK